MNVPEEVESAPLGLSKTAQKKWAKKQRWKDLRSWKQDKRKDDERRERQQSFQQLSESEQQAHRDARHAKKQEQKEEAASKKTRLKEAKKVGPRVVIDLASHTKMSEKEAKSLCQQLTSCYSVNARSSSPVHLHLTGITADISATLTKQTAGSENWVISRNEENYEKVLANQKQDLVYLTPDASDVLESMEPSKTYIIGGLIDKNRNNQLRQRKAEIRGLTTARLPIQEHLKLPGTQFLTVHQVVTILVHWQENRDWKVALEKTIPSRKLKATGTVAADAAAADAAAVDAAAPDAAAPDAAAPDATAPDAAVADAAAPDAAAPDAAAPDAAVADAGIAINLADVADTVNRATGEASTSALQPEPGPNRPSGKAREFKPKINNPRQKKKAKDGAGNPVDPDAASGGADSMADERAQAGGGRGKGQEQGPDEGMLERDQYYPTSLPPRDPARLYPDKDAYEDAGPPVDLHTLQADEDVNVASALGLLQPEGEQAPHTLFQLPSILPATAQHGKRQGAGPAKMGKLLVFESGAVKMQLGDVVLDVNLGSECECRQDVAAIDAAAGHCVVMGDIAHRAVCSPNIDQLLGGEPAPQLMNARSAIGPTAGMPGTPVESEVAEMVDAMDLDEK